MFKAVGIANPQVAAPTLRRAAQKENPLPSLVEDAKAVMKNMQRRRRR